MESDERTKECKKFNIISYNVRCCNDKLRYDVDGKVEKRAKMVIQNIFLYMPDSVGFQEVTTSKDLKKPAWLNLLREGLKEKYEGVGVGRSSDLSGEANPIFYNRNKLELIKEGTKWLSPEPEKPGSKFENTKSNPTDTLPRIFTFIIVKNKLNGVEYMHINTHLDYKEPTNRIRQIKVIMDFVSSYNNKYPIILTGDFNCGLSIEKNKINDAIPFLLNSGYIDASSEAIESDNHWTFPTIDYIKEVYSFCKKRGHHNNGKNIDEQKFCDKDCDKERGNVIDFCLRANNMICFSKYKVITDCKSCGGISSDHYPIYIEGNFL